MLLIDLNGNNKFVFSVSHDENGELLSVDSFVVACCVVVLGSIHCGFVCLKSIAVNDEGLDLCVRCRFVSVFRCRAIALEQQACFDHKCSKRCHSTAQHGLGALLILSLSVS